MRGDDRWARIAAVLDAASRELPSVGTICDGARRVLGADGSSIMFHSSSGLLTMTGSDLMASDADEVQVITGEGPAIDAESSNLPVVAEDLHGVGDRWVMASRGLELLGLASALALPLRQGRARLGVLSWYWESSTRISAEQFADAVVLAELATELVLQHLATGSIDVESAVSMAALGSTIVQQAVGVLAERHGIEMTAAQVRLRAAVFQSGVSLERYAERIVNGEDPEELDS